MEKKMWATLWLMEASLFAFGTAQTPKEYFMDEFATCGRTINVDDTGIRLIGRSNAAPSNPPTECIVYLQSVYARDDGSNKLQIKIESLSIRDCNVIVDLYDGRTSVGATLRAMSCQYSSTDLVNSTGREVTVRLTRPDRIIFNDYQFTLEIKPFGSHRAESDTEGDCSFKCQQERETCFNSYMDNLLNHTAYNLLHHTNQVVRLCQDMNTFVSCMLKNDPCEPEKEEIWTTIKEEMLRLLPDCAVYGSNRGSLNILSQVSWLLALLTLVLTVN